MAVIRNAFNIEDLFFKAEQSLLTASCACCAWTEDNGWSSTMENDS